MTNEILKSKCGRTTSRTNKRQFTPTTLRQHEMGCKRCNPRATVTVSSPDDDEGLLDAGLDPEAYRMAEMIGGDESDAVFWAMYAEMNGDY